MAKPGLEQVFVTDTFQGWLNKTNEVVTLFNTEVMTASVLGDTTTGNATLLGTFTANTVNVVDTLSANTTSVLSIRQKDSLNNDISVISPVSISSITENMLTLTSPAEYKPQLRLVNGSNIRWMLSHNNASTTSSFVIQTEGAATPQVSITQAGRVVATEFQGDGANITNLNASAVPSLDASKVTTGILAPDRIPNIDASKVTTGEFNAARIPNLNASKISTGVLADARLPTNIVRSSRRFIQGNGIAISGNGDLTTDRTISVVIASETQATTGAGNNSLMTPERTAQAIAALTPPGVPAGSVMYVAMDVPPAGYLKANGAAVSRTLFPALFAAIGTRYGAGDGSTTFNVPDLRGEFIRGWSDGRNVDTGRTLGSFQADELRSHSHSAPSGSGGSSTIRFAMQESAAGNDNPFLAFVNASGGAETRPRNIALLAVIKF